VLSLIFPLIFRVSASVRYGRIDSRNTRQRQHLRLKALAFQLVQGHVQENAFSSKAVRGLAVEGLEEDAIEYEGVGRSRTCAQAGGFRTPSDTSR
jgi:hypothetical protein